MSEFRVDQIKNQAGTAGPQVAGITTFSGVSGIVMPSGATEYRGGRGRGLFGGGLVNPSPTFTNVIDYVTIASTGNAKDFGDLTVARRFVSGCASSTRGLFGGGNPGNSNVIDYVTVSSTGNAFDFGDLLAAASISASCSSSVRGLFMGGSRTNFSNNTIDYVTIATLGNASLFGNLNTSADRNAGCSSPTRGLSAGSGSTGTKIIDYVTIATLGDAQDFGDLTKSIGNMAGCSNATRGLFAGGYANPTTVFGDNIINYVTIASLGDAIDFGDLNNLVKGSGACASPLRGLFAGGYNPSPAAANLNVIDYVTIATTGNATDFGDMTTIRQQLTGCSDAHGGLGD